MIKESRVLKTVVDALDRISRRFIFWARVLTHYIGADFKNELRLAFSGIVDLLLYGLSLFRFNRLPGTLCNCLVLLRRYGVYFFVRSKSDDLYNISYRREGDVHDFILNNLEPGDVFVDVGANIGYYALLASKVTQTSGLVLAIEPVPRTVEILKREMNLNKTDNVIVIDKGVSNRNATETIFVPANYFGQASRFDAFRTSRARNLVRVRTTTLDEVCEHTKVIKMLKIDVEGAELWALLGGKKTLSKTEYLAIEVSQHKAEILKLLNRCGFQCHKAAFSARATAYYLCRKRERKIEADHHDKLAGECTVH